MRARVLLLHMQRICSKTRPAPVRQAGAVAIHSLFRRFRRSRTRKSSHPIVLLSFFNRRYRRRNSKITAGNNKITATVEVLCIRWQAAMYSICSPKPASSRTVRRNSAAACVKTEIWICGAACHPQPKCAKLKRPKAVMPGLCFGLPRIEGVDGRAKPGHDGQESGSV